MSAYDTVQRTTNNGQTVADQVSVAFELLSVKFAQYFALFLISPNTLLIRPYIDKTWFNTVLTGYSYTDNI